MTAQWCLGRPGWHSRGPSEDHVCLHVLLSPPSLARGQRSTVVPVFPRLAGGADLPVECSLSCRQAWKCTTAERQTGQPRPLQSSGAGAGGLLPRVPSLPFQASVRSSLSAPPGSKANMPGAQAGTQSWVLLEELCPCCWCVTLPPLW